MWCWDWLFCKNIYWLLCAPPPICGVGHLKVKLSDWLGRTCKLACPSHEKTKLCHPQKLYPPFAEPIHSTNCQLSIGRRKCFNFTWIINLIINRKNWVIHDGLLCFLWPVYISYSKSTLVRSCQMYSSQMRMSRRMTTARSAENLGNSCPASQSSDHWPTCPKVGFANLFKCHHIQWNHYDVLNTFKTDSFW